MVGDFTGWGPDDGWPMRSLGSSGVWELFVPNARVGARYKYRVLGADGQWRDKADPLAAYAEVPPATASVVHHSTYRWNDADWLARRAERQPHQEPMSVYEVHLGSWRPGLSYRELADQLTAYVTELGFTHVEFLPVMEHPFGGSWGYQVTGYYAPTSRFGDPDEFRHLVDRLHAAGIGVILDWVPAHFPKDEWALGRFDGTPLYEHPDPRRGEHPDWGTYVFDFGRNEVRNFLVANALYWCDQFHVDGLRVDAVASMLYLDYSRNHGEWAPNKYGGRENLEALALMQEVNATVYKHHAGVVMIAEESTAWPGVTSSTAEGGLGFGFKWNMGWMHDTLLYTSKDPIYRQHHHHQLTFSLAYAWSENYVLPISHDEVVHGKGSLAGKMPGDTWQRLANVRALLAYMWAHPGKQLLFMGSELADDREWSEERGLDWYLLHDPARAGVQRLVADLNRVYRDTPALWAQDTEPAGFRWIMRRRRRQQHRVVRPDRPGRLDPGLRGELLRPAAARLPDRVAGRRDVAGGAQHRRAPLRRLGGGQPGRGTRRGRAVARHGRLRGPPGATAGCRLAPPGLSQGYLDWLLRQCFRCSFRSAMARGGQYAVPPKRRDAPGERRGSEPGDPDSVGYDVPLGAGPAADPDDLARPRGEVVGAQHPPLAAAAALVDGCRHGSVRGGHQVRRGAVVAGVRRVPDLDPVRAGGGQRRAEPGRVADRLRLGESVVRAVSRGEVRRRAPGGGGGEATSGGVVHDHAERAAVTGDDPRVAGRALVVQPVQGGHQVAVGRARPGGGIGERPGAARRTHRAEQVAGVGQVAGVDRAITGQSVHRVLGGASGAATLPVHCHAAGAAYRRGEVRRGGR